MRRTLFTALLMLTALPLPAVSLQQALPDSTIEARRRDLQVFRTDFLNRDQAYAPDARAEAERRLAALEAGAERVSDVWFDLELARIVALADNGHTVMFAGPRAARYNRIPLRLVPLDGGWYVLRAAPSHRDLLGARLVSVDGRTVGEVVDSARTLAGGTPERRDRSASYFLESPEQMRALRLAAAADRATYRWELPDGRLVDRALIGEPPAPDRDGLPAGRFLYPEPLEGAAADWIPLLPAERAPWVFQDAGVPFRWRRAPELDAVVLQFRANTNARGVRISEFLSMMTDTIPALAPTNVIVDMRGNGGGDLNTTRGFLRRLTTWVPGRIFVLTSAWTFSAGISSVGYLKQEAPDRVTIVGEMVGDRLEFWAEGSPMTLPGTGNRVLYATERHDYRNGCKAFTDCHGSVVRNPIAVPSLAPEIPAPLTLEAYAAGRDPGMEAVAAALRTP